MVILIKPQFEVGKARSAKAASCATRRCTRPPATACEQRRRECGFTTDIMESPIHGAEGNKEFLLYARSLRRSGSSPSRASEQPPRDGARSSSPGCSSAGSRLRIDEDTAAYAATPGIAARGGARGLRSDDRARRRRHAAVGRAGDRAARDPAVPGESRRTRLPDRDHVDELYPELQRALRSEHRIGKRKLLTGGGRTRRRGGGVLRRAE